MVTYGWDNHDSMTDNPATVTCQDGATRLYGYPCPDVMIIRIEQFNPDNASLYASIYLSRTEAIYLRNALTTFIERPITGEV